MKKNVLTFIFAFLFHFVMLADGTLMSWGMNDLIGMTKERFDAAKNWPVDDILKNNIESATWPDVYLVAVGASSKKDLIIDLLVEQLDNATITKLTLTKRLIIWERILSGEILFEGKGLQINDDLFSVAGRANWILRNITKKNFGYVNPNSTAEEMAALKLKWKQWRSGKQVEEYVDPFDSKEKGLDETHSMIAFEALIYSLKPSPEKAALTKDCLKKIYKLDEMPKEKESPANYCNPDNYTLFYLNALIGEKEPGETRDYEWWSKWWNENKSKLAWNADKGIFQTSK